MLALGFGLSLAEAAPPEIASLGVRNAASFGFARSGGGIAPGSIFVVFGAGLGPETPLQGTIPYPSSLPDDSTGTRVVIHSLESDTTVAAYLLYTSASQVMAILPSETPLGQAEVTVTFEGETSEPQELNILPRAIGIFTQGMDGRGPGVIQNVVSASDQPLNQLTKPALPGQYIVLWATGLGAISEPDNAEPPVGSVADDVEVEIAGTRLKASYAGRAPGFPGVDQINVRLPDDGEPLDNCYVALRVWAGERPSQQVVFSAAASPGPCKHPYGFSPETLASLDAGGRVALGEIRLNRNAQEISLPDFEPSRSSVSWASGGFFAVDALDLAIFAPPLGGDGLGEGLGCQIVSSLGVAAIWFNSDNFVVQAPESRIVQLDAGESLQLAGPGSKQLLLSRHPANGSPLVFDYFDQQTGPDGSCCQSLPGDFLESGEWTLQGAGGTDVGPFEETLQLPPFPEMEVPETVNHLQDLELTWPSVGYGESDRIVVGIGSLTEVEIGGQTLYVTRSQVRCSVPAAEGRVTLPASLMADTLTPSGERQGSVFIGVIRPEEDAAAFSAPGIDHGIVRFTYSRFESVDIE